MAVLALAKIFAGSPVAGGFGGVVDPFGKQHLKSLGPGQSPEAMLPVLQDEVNRQFPPFPHLVLVQHLMLSGVPGQALLM